MRCLKEGFQQQENQNLQTRNHTRPRWCPVENSRWWNLHVVIESFQRDGYLLRYACALPINYLFHLIILPEWGYSCLHYSSLMEYFYSKNIAVWILDQRSQGGHISFPVLTSVIGLSEVINPHSNLLCIQNFACYQTDLYYFSEEIVQKSTLPHRIPINLLLFNHCGGWFMKNSIHKSIFSKIFCCQPLRSPSFIPTPTIRGIVPSCIVSIYKLAPSQVWLQVVNT